VLRLANEFMARRTANELLTTLGIDTYPVYPDAIAAKLGFPVDDIPGFPPHCFGALSIVDGKFRILISDACPTDGLRRFTLSHEIGHAAIDGHTDAMRWVEQGSDTQIAFSEGHYRSMKDPVEVEADHFASELLMPERWVRPVVDTLPAGMDAIRIIADRFQTSLSSAAVRYAQLSVAAVVVLLTRGDSVEWVTASREVQQADFFRYNAIRTAKVPPGSATRRLADDLEAVRASREDSSTDYLRDWFPRAPNGTTVEVDALGLGSYGRVISLLICHDLPNPDALYLQEQYGEEQGDDDRDWRSELRRQAGYGDC
jgi:hypothetical protein